MIIQQTVMQYKLVRLIIDYIFKTGEANYLAVHGG